MTKTLSQREIDALLNSVGTGGVEASGSGSARVLRLAEPDPRNVKLYDFRRPDKFSKEHIRALQNVHEQFARLTASTLSSYLRSITTVHLSSVEQVVYDEYVHQLATPTIIHMVEMGGLLAGRIILEMNMQVTLAILDRMMGGGGRVGHARDDLTDIELSLVRGLGNLLVGSLRDAWSVVTPVQPVLQETALSGEFVQAALPGDISVLLLLEVQTLGVGGTISLCLPHPVIEPVMESLSTQVWFTSGHKAAGQDDRSKLDRCLREVPLPLNVELGTTAISVGELMGLRIGDVLRLDRLLDADLVVKVGGEPRFLARPGVVAGNRAIQVTGVLADEAEQFDGAVSAQPTLARAA